MKIAEYYDKVLKLEDTIKGDIGKVVIGRARYLLSIVLYTWMFESSLFR